MMGGYGYDWTAMPMMVLGMLLITALVVGVVWVLIHWMSNRQVLKRDYARQSQDFSHEYEQGYQRGQQSMRSPQEAATAAYYRQPQDEQPQVEYPQEVLPPQ